ncbi:MAG: 2-oxoacid:ferredoxin oxidoreductase subunit beta [Nanoarchaeota archaeon]|nr:2-oxoacid:ferredoxin oxidoreductase subunit beta [Nanoarchaeota archaeon]MBU1623197.1 2-oxoacid:ferredoxin oxidoreductase subunit beta [Nanoarchaeota archaeon]MBU1974215.1 2-oxoacid:ferredoxin oxidoreductase subunit beta [Nanoarchaeota archaeon]
MFETKNENTWCPGCPNFMIEAAVKKVLENLTKSNYKKEDFAMVTDIGCNSKIYDYLDISGFYGLHGRAIPTAFGVKVGNPKLQVLCFSGDGGAFSEGLSHFIHACRSNINMTLLVHNNQVFSLTTGQATATTEKGFVERTHPFGVQEKALNPVVLALEAGASFVSRVSALDPKQLIFVIGEAIKHSGFSFVEIIQPCKVYHDCSTFVRENSYQIKPMLFVKAVEEARKWDYAQAGKIPFGIFFKERRKTFEENYLVRG